LQKKARVLHRRIGQTTHLAFYDLIFERISVGVFVNLNEGQKVSWLIQFYAGQVRPFSGIPHDQWRIQWGCHGTASIFFSTSICANTICKSGEKKLN
jgi:hypothetical protein